MESQFQVKKRQRQMSQELLVNDLESESAPFSFGLKHGGEDLRLAPLVYVQDLVALVFHLLEQNDRYMLHVLVRGHVHVQ